TSLREVVFQGSGEISVPRPWRSDAFVLGRISCANRQRLLPVFPVLVLQQDSDRRSNRHALPDAGENVSAVALNLHASAPAIPFLASPQLPIKKGLIHLQPGWHARQECNQGFAVGLAGGEVAQHGTFDSIRSPSFRTSWVGGLLGRSTDRYPRGSVER